MNKSTESKAVEASRSRGHYAGIAATIWAIFAWAEWWIVLLMVEDNGGPVPYIAFAPQLLVLIGGCILLLGCVLLKVTQWKWRIAYSILPLTYLGFLVWRMS